MTPLDLLGAAALRAEQLWYVAHPVHPLDEEVARFRSVVMGAHTMTDRGVREAIVRSNITGAQEWMRWLKKRYPPVTFIAPWISAIDGGGDDDLDPVLRRRGIRDCCRTIRACNGIVLVGGRVSAGMTEESGSALSVIDLTALGRNPPTDAFQYAAPPSSEDSR